MQVFEGEVVGRDRRGSVRRVRRAGPVRGDAARSPAARRLVGAQRARARCSSGPAPAARFGSATRCRCGSRVSTRLAVGWICSRRGRIESMAKGRKRKAAPGDVATNRQASFRFNLLERFECGTRAHRHRGQVAARGQGPAQGLLRDDPRRRGVADRRLHPALRSRVAGEPRPRAPAQAAAAPLRDRAADRPDRENAA